MTRNDIAARARRGEAAMSALRDAGFVRREGPETYVASPEGLEALERLRDGHSVVAEAPRPNCRLFGEAA